MPLKDLLIALVVIIAWGVNFVVIKVGLDGLPPMLLGALRFALVAFPAILLVKRPKLPWRWLIAYGATISWDSSRSCSRPCTAACHRGWPRWCCNLRRSSPWVLPRCFG